MSRQQIAKKYLDIVEFSEVGKFIDTPVKRYSSGMYVKLAFAVAAHMEPEILLLDEVLSVGDLAFQRKCMEHAKRMIARNTTLLFVSHNMFAIKALCPRSIYLSGGSVVADGPTDAVVGRYEQESNLDIASWALTSLGSDPEKCPIYFKELDFWTSTDLPAHCFATAREFVFAFTIWHGNPSRTPTSTSVLSAPIMWHAATITRRWINA